MSNTKFDFNDKMYEHPFSVLKEEKLADEVSIQKGKAVSRIFSLTAFIMPILSFFIMPFVMEMIIKFGSLLAMLAAILFIMAMVLLLLYGIKWSHVRRTKLEKICTVRVKGYFEGYEYRNKYDKVFAPKYKVLINGGYEIRTVDDFSFSGNRPAETDFFVNPNGYEIIFADNSYNKISSTCIIGGMMTGIFIMFALFIKSGLVI